MRTASWSDLFAVLIFPLCVGLALLFPAVMEGGLKTKPSARIAIGEEGQGIKRFSNGRLSLTIQEARRNGRSEFWIKEVQLKMSKGRQTILYGIDGREFSTSLGSANAIQYEVVKNDATGLILRMSCRQEAWEAEEEIELAASSPVLQRKQTYRFLKTCEGAVHPGFLVKAQSDLRYTYPMWAHEQLLTDMKPLRYPVDAAVPLPFHVWHDSKYVALYGVDKSLSLGTIDFVPVAADGCATLRVYYPDSTPPNVPETTKLAVGNSLTLVEVVAAKPLAAGDNALLEAERIAASILLRKPPHTVDLKGAARGLADYFQHCELWQPSAFGSGRGWFANMWVRTQKGPAKKRGEYNGYFDLGWGEGEAVYTWMGAVRFWKRTGDVSLLPYVDEMTKNLDLFRRSQEPDAPYYDRSDGRKFGDFGMGDRIWTHSLGDVGCQMIQLYQSVVAYPNAEAHQHWLAAATSIARFFAQHQKTDGDLQDIFGPNNEELNKTPRRCSGRVAVCGLWARLSQVTGDKTWAQRALRLAKVVAPEIRRYEFFLEMMDHSLGSDCVAGDAAFRVLEGLVPLYATTRDPEVLSLCKAAAAFGFAWTYFYDIPVPKTHNGITRGAQCCCNHYPYLVFVIGPAMGVEPLLTLSQLTSDPIYQQMAAELISYIGNSQITAPGKPWNGGIIHAFGQNCGKYWGPDFDGQVDTGMSSGNSLAAIEAWLAYQSRSDSRKRNNR